MAPPNTMSSLAFPFAQQAQIIRSNQRDYFHVSSLREQTDNVLRTWLGTRWLSRWEKEVEFAAKVLYYGLTVGRATQTLGEEYTGIWLHSVRAHQPPPHALRAALVLVPTLPSYIIARWGSGLPADSRLSAVIRKVPTLLEVLSEINLAVFYLQGTYYTVTRRLLGVRYVSSTLEDPNSRPPSYSLLGVLLAIRLLYRLITFIRDLRPTENLRTLKGKRHADEAHETYVDDIPVSSMLGPEDPEGEPVIPAEEDERTILDVAAIPAAIRATRNCTLCLEERTSSCATECGHLFCWNCIVGWGREKVTGSLVVFAVY
ncbi:hypothetical protein NM688_g3238 [Phlebia brevispora]|uniref:Uncharacterized protein n=1 Tax=Phlebia brevispora TaxID=194682 RepID=A0ACC1T634_9APHY|nr:hypothetical protein NM688_g3238 [Phlebia brevispora]